MWDGRSVSMVRDGRRNVVYLALYDFRWYSRPASSTIGNRLLFRHYATESRADHRWGPHVATIIRSGEL